MVDPKFFTTPKKFYAWLEKNHERHDELWVGFYKKATGKKSITWPESVDQALCFGWIDGIRKTIDEEAYKIRFTPRRKSSNWSAVNIKRIAELIEQGLVHKSGLAAYERRTEKTSLNYAYEQGLVKLSGEYLKQLKANKKAWEFYKTLAPSYKKPSIWWVMSAKRKETQVRRLGVLIDCCQRGEKIPGLVNKRKKKK